MQSMRRRQERILEHRQHVLAATVTGYVLATHRAEWSGYSLAAFRFVE